MNEKLDDKITILYNDDDILVVKKNAGIPSAPLKSNETDNALFYVSKIFPQIINVKNLYKKVEGGLIHRIDTDTEGLLLFALNDESWQNLYLQQKSNSFTKEYTALCNKIDDNSRTLPGFPEFVFQDINLYKNILIQSKFRNYGPKGREVRPVLKNENTYAQKKASNKLYSTEILEVNKFDNYYKILCKINSGYRHQVRCHLAWAGFPIINDKIYNSSCVENDSVGNLQFYASKLEFYHPKTNQLVKFAIDV